MRVPIFTISNTKCWCTLKIVWKNLIIKLTIEESIELVLRGKFNNAYNISIVRNSSIIRWIIKTSMEKSQICAAIGKSWKTYTWKFVDFFSFGWIFKVQKKKTHRRNRHREIAVSYSLYVLEYFSGWNYSRFYYSSRFFYIEILIYSLGKYVPFCLHYEESYEISI